MNKAFLITTIITATLANGIVKSATCPNESKHLIFYGHIQRYGARTPQKFNFRNDNYPGLGYGELTD